ncbi:MAG: hypothetical protein ACREQQ_11450 [Candidatus Binatia bacterium]
MSRWHRRSSSIGWKLAILVSVLVAPRTIPAEAAGFVDLFAVTTSLEEAGSITESASPNWWVNSGGRFIQGGNVGATIRGELPAADRWRLAYLIANPVDTDDGYHPQNVFRLIQRQLWTNGHQRVYFRVRETNLSASPNRNASNGVLLLNRYLDSQNLYYAGIRVDGAAVIKKKVGGQYFTLAYLKILPGTYHPTNNPNLLQKDQLIGIESRVSTNDDGSVTVALWIDRLDGGGWQLAMEAVDRGTLGGPPITAAGHGGIRTDFMDVEFQSYRIDPIADDHLFANGFEAN